jgi:hypothetical protein
MRSTTAWAPSVVLLTLSAALLTACGERGGDGEQRADAAALELDSSEAAGPVRAREQRAGEHQPDTRTDERRRQDSVLRTPGDRHRKKLGSDSTYPP